MEVTRYLFKSPSTSQVQIGTPDPSSKKETEAQQKSQEDTEKLTKETNSTLKEAESFATTQTKEVEPKVSPKTEVAAVQEVQKAKEAQKSEKITGVKETTGVEAQNVTALEQTKQNNSIWSRQSEDKDSNSDIWSRKSRRSNNIWSRKGDTTGHFSNNNIWSRGTDSLKVEGSGESTTLNNRFDFSKIKQALDFFA